MVCISGGKDSFLMAKCMQELVRHGKFPFDVKYVVMNPGYNEYNLKVIKDNAKLLNIPILVFESDIFEVADKVGGESPCYLCARMRRGYLYSKAKELGCNKIALGHHFNDVIETTLLSMFYGSEVKTMMPKLHSTYHEGMELIRPLYLIREKDIIAWAKYNGLEFIRCACKFDNADLETNVRQRVKTKMLIEELRKNYNENAEKNIFAAGANVNLDKVIAYKTDKKLHSFLDTYDNED
jgi:tRNA(Ile)-lysidine synthase TilS/MesJ